MTLTLDTQVGLWIQTYRLTGQVLSFPYKLLNLNEVKVVRTCINAQFQLEKGFQKKSIVAFTNSTVFILDFNI